jgi:hypothetical protein
MKTIRVQLHGGLGNQLFIWAMAHEILLATGINVQLEYVKDRNQRNDRPIEIERLFDACPHKISLNQSRSTGIFFRLLDKLGLYSKNLQGVLKEIFRVYDCNTSYEIPDFSKRTPRFVRGYFQSAEMVGRNKVIIEEEINAVLRAEGLDQEIHTDMVLHIRRGDTRGISKYWGVLSLNYYLNQVDINLPFTISVDDTKEVDVLQRQFPNATFLTPDNSTTWQTLKVMSEARILIIANSTLSWWGAWLKSNTNPNSIYFPDSWRPNDDKTFESLQINCAHIIKSDFEV